MQKPVRLRKLRTPLLTLLGSGLLITSVLLSSCTDQPVVAVPTVTEAPTIAYLPPTVIPSVTRTAPPSPTAVRQTQPPAPPTATPPPGPAPAGGVPQVYGQLILVSLSQQWLWAYQDRHLLYDTPMTSGMPQLPTPDGTFHVQFHAADITFYSPWPPGSPYYYSPEHINYALYFLDNGYYIHDAPWRETFGPGTNYPHTEPDGTTATGSHGCVNVPTPAGKWLYYWAYDGATVVIYGTAPVGPPPATATPKPTATTAPQATATATPTATQSATPTPTP